MGPKILVMMIKKTFMRNEGQRTLKAIIVVESKRILCVLSQNTLKMGGKAYS